LNKARILGEILVIGSRNGDPLGKFVWDLYTGSDCLEVAMEHDLYMKNSWYRGVRNRLESGKPYEEL
jgi:hypothetical protein